MRLFIAEKPSVAKAIAGVLGITGKGDGYIECGSNKITWCFGHMLEYAEPDVYTSDDVSRNSNGKKIWRIEDLPIIPNKWIIEPKADAKKQLSIIGRLIKEANEIVHAGDPDREGQLLVDEVLQYFKVNSSVRIYRFWVSSQDAITVSRGLKSLKENNTYHGWGEAALGRARADWLIGMNLSRAYTLRARRGGSNVLLTVGRVQTPTLALVVKRDREIEAFKPMPYHRIKANIQHEKGVFVATWQAKEDQEGLDDEGRLINGSIAENLVLKVNGKAGFIKEYKQELKKQNQPLAFALSDITLLASNKYGYSAEDVLNTCQALYETHKLVSYPRTDCAYLPQVQHADAGAVLNAVKHVNPDLSSIIDDADISLISTTWNDAKITAHHGIIPTMHKGDRSVLNERERNIYELIVRAYIAQFYPVHEYLHTNIDTEIEGEIFKASGKEIKKNGWRDVYSPSEEDSLHSSEKDEDVEQQNLPSMKQGDILHCMNAICKVSKTKPPKRFTEGTLIRAMENIHKFISDPQHKKILRDGDGIGTSATRASIISELKRREFLQVKGKNLISTTLGRNLIDVLPDVVKSPILTAIYERMLKNIEQGSGIINDFMKKQEDFIIKEVSKANSGSVTIVGEKDTTKSSNIHKCMSCGAGLIRRPAKKKGNFWWGCATYPACKQSYPDLKGKPDYNKGR